MIHSKHSKRTKRRYELLGKYYGYPKCCIDSFIVNTKRTRNFDKVTICIKIIFLYYLSRTYIFL